MIELEELKKNILDEYNHLGKRIFDRGFRHATKTPHQVLTERKIMFKVLDNYLPREKQLEFYNNDCWEAYVKGYEEEKANPSAEYYQARNFVDRVKEIKEKC